MNYFWNIFEFILCATEVLMLYLYCYKVVGLNSKYKWYHFLTGGIIIILIIYTLTIINTYYTLKSIIFIVLLTLYPCIFCSTNIKNRILFSLLFIILLLFSDVFSMNIIVIGKQFVLPNAILIKSYDRIFVGILSKAIFVIVIAIVIKLSNRDKDFLPFKHWLFFIVIFSFIMISVLLLLNLGFEIVGNKNFNNVILIVILTFSLVYILIYYNFYHLNKYYKKLHYEELLQFENELIEKYILQKEESDRMIKILSHDLKHNLILWEDFAKKKKFYELSKHIFKYNELLKENELIDVNNDIANAIINQKILISHKNNIKLKVKGGFHENILLSDTEICSLLGNLLDNAIEASLNITNIDKREINITISRDRKFAFINIKNNYEIQPILINKNYLTTKKNRHKAGIGMISINKIVNMYDGAIEIKNENNVFETNIMIRVY